MKNLVKTTIHWSDTDEVPEPNQPVLCYTENGNLMTFKNVKDEQRWKTHYCSKYAVVLWAYQAEISIELAKAVFGALGSLLGK